MCALRGDGEAECWGNRTWWNGYDFLTLFGDWEQPAGRFTQVAAYSGSHDGKWAYACGIRADTTIACWDFGLPEHPFSLTDPPPAPPAQIPQPGAPALGADFAASTEWIGLNDAVLLEWDEVSGATGYEVMWHSEDGWSLLSGGEIVGGVAMEFDANNFGDKTSAFVAFLPEPERLTGYWFSVRAINQRGPSEWSSPFSVAVPAYVFAPELNILGTYFPRDWQRDDMPAGAGFSSVAVAEYEACALRIDNTVTCWGRTETGPSSFHPSSTISPPGEFTEIPAASQAEHGYFCGLRADASAVCWSSFDRRTRGPLEPEARALGVARLGDGYCAIDTGGQPVCWLHPNLDYSDQPPEQVRPLAAAAVGPYGGCGIRLSDSTLACWGDDRTADAPEGSFAAVAASTRREFCAVAADGSLVCWGVHALHAPDGQFTKVAAGYEHACAIRADQTVACWGDDGRWSVEDVQPSPD